MDCHINSNIHAITSQNVIVNTHQKNGTLKKLRFYPKLPYTKTQHKKNKNSKYAQKQGEVLCGMHFGLEKT
jgi:hypothetical protein